MGRFLGGVRLSGLGFLGGVLFLRKKSFYVFLRPNQLLHLVPCFAVALHRCTSPPADPEDAGWAEDWKMPAG